MRWYWLLTFTVVGYTSVFGQVSKQVTYKQIDTISLTLDVYYPTNYDTSSTYPAIIFFFGGGWISGGPGHFEHHARYFAQRGAVCFLADYRTQNRHQSTPFEALADAKSAMRFVREHAEQYRIDTHQIVAAGGSAGGHLAAATALIEGFNDSSDHLSIVSLR